MRIRWCACPPNARRVADALLQLHEQTGLDGGIHLPHDDMAAMVDTAPEFLIRTLSVFKQNEPIDIILKSIRAPKPEKLRRAKW